MGKTARTGRPDTTHRTTGGNRLNARRDRDNSSDTRQRVVNKENYARLASTDEVAGIPPTQSDSHTRTLAHSLLNSDPRQQHSSSGVPHCTYPRTRRRCHTLRHCTLGRTAAEQSRRCTATPPPHCRSRPHTRRGGSATRRHTPLSTTPSHRPAAAQTWHDQTSTSPGKKPTIRRTRRTNGSTGRKYSNTDLPTIGATRCLKAVGGRGWGDCERSTLCQWHHTVSHAADVGERHIRCCDDAVLNRQPV